MPIRRRSYEYGFVLLIVAALTCRGVARSEDNDHDPDDDPELAGVRNGNLRHPAVAISSSADLNVAAARGGNPETNRCSDVDLSLFSKGMECGPPLSLPCFNHSRCSSERAGIYVFDVDCSLNDTSALLPVDEAQEPPAYRMNHAYVEWAVRMTAKDAGVLAETYEEACLFVHVGVGRTPCAVHQPLWNNGANHIMIDMSDEGRGSRPEVADSYAMEAASNMHTCFYRGGYDISVSLAPPMVFHDLGNIDPWDRKFFLTTKGTLYLSGHGSEERMSLVRIRDDVNGVVTSMKCFENHGEHLFLENTQFCQALKIRYEEDDYVGLMNTTFGLVPAGRSPGTFRLGEVMSAGSIPVFVGRDLVPPFLEQLDWPSFSFSFTPDQVGPEMIRTLLAVPRAELESMQRKSLDAFRELFGTDVDDFRPSAKLLVNILLRRLEYRGG